MDTPTTPPQPVPMQNPVPAPAAPSSPGTRWGIVIGVFAVIVLVGGVAAYLADLLPFGAAPEMTPEPSASANAVSATPLPAGVKSYRSDTLGISFEYLASEGDPVIEEGDTVYVGGKQGQWVRVFTKAPGDNLEAAITKKFLAGVPAGKCIVRITAEDVNPDITFGTIGFDFEPTDPGDPRIDSSPCPAEYRITNGIRYFSMDSNHPDRFFFFSIGQYAIFAESNVVNNRQVTWQDTFEVLNIANPSAAANAGQVDYVNAEHGFILNFPASWAGYTVEKLNPPLQGMTATYAIRPREPKTPQEELPVITIDVFTEAQWAAEQTRNQPHPTELGRGRVSTSYVYATPFRYDYLGLPYESDIEDILKSFGVISM